MSWVQKAHQTPADARRAASLMLLRDGAAGLEVLMLRRAERDGDLRSGACVFPGGVLEAADRSAHAWCLGPDDAAFSARLGLPEGGLDYAIAAVRESFEEVGLLLACRPDGRAVDLAPLAADLAPWRIHLQQQLHRGAHDIAALCRAFDLRLDLRGLHYFSHWLTPPGVPKRFDTRFFTALAPVGHQAEADRSEAVELMWTRPADALAPGSGYKLLPVTQCTLQELQRQPDAAAAHTEAGQRRDIGLTMPRRGQTRKGPRIVLPWEPGHAELGRLDPEGHHGASAEIVPGVAVRLSPRVLRITAPNAGMMTGPGTNSYLVGAPEGGPLVLIDPGPEDAAHRAAILLAAPRAITHVITTHTHADHSPGAAALAQATGALVWGRRAPPHAGQDQGFAPHLEPADGETLVLGDGSTLQAVHTPGHASNHLCWLLADEKTLFTGDHVMQGSTVVINPPDGDMVAYLLALHKLLALDLDWLAPGHGFLVDQPHTVVRALIAHRLRREAKVLAALQASGPAALAALVPAAYDDTPVALHPVAQRSLLAHLLKLQADGAARESDGLWSAV